MKFFMGQMALGVCAIACVVYVAANAREAVKAESPCCIRTVAQPEDLTKHETEYRIQSLEARVSRQKREIVNLQTQVKLLQANHK